MRANYLASFTGVHTIMKPRGIIPTDFAWRAFWPTWMTPSHSPISCLHDSELRYKKMSKEYNQLSIKHHKLVNTGKSPEPCKILK